MDGVAGVVARVAAGVLLADFVTAAGHWIEDTYLPHTRAPGLLGEIARDNDMHHFIPYAVVSSSYWGNMQVSAGLVAAVAAAAWAMAPRWVARHRVTLITAALVTTLASLAHRFQHERPCTRPRVVTALQRAGVLESSERHAVHHRTSSRRYGVLLGFTNDVYDGLGVWRGLEAALAVVGLKPGHRKPVYRQYQALYDQDLARNLAGACPRPLTQAQLATYHQRLERAHASGRL